MNPLLVHTPQHIFFSWVNKQSCYNAGFDQNLLMQYFNISLQFNNLFCILNFHPKVGILNSMGPKLSIVFLRYLFWIKWKSIWSFQLCKVLQITIWNTSRNVCIEKVKKMGIHNTNPGTYNRKYTQSSNISENVEWGHCSQRTIG